MRLLGSAKQANSLFRKSNSLHFASVTVPGIAERVLKELLDDSRHAMSRAYRANPSLLGTIDLVALVTVFVLGKSNQSRTPKQDAGIFEDKQAP
jgi:hypothetical protein